MEKTIMLGFIGTPGIWELIFVFLIVLVVFGAKKLPEIGSGLGKGITNFKKAMKNQDSLDSKSSDEENSDEENKE